VSSRQRGVSMMMGTKERNFAPLINVSLEELVPQDHFYRHLERALVCGRAPCHAGQYPV